MGDHGDVMCAWRAQSTSKERHRTRITTLLCYSRLIYIHICVYIYKREREREAGFLKKKGLNWASLVGHLFCPALKIDKKSCPFWMGTNKEKAAFLVRLG